MTDTWPESSQFETPMVARTWREDWPVTLLNRKERSFFPPGQAQSVARGTIGKTPGVRLLIAESGCGTTAFKQWANDAARERRASVVHLNGTLEVHGSFAAQASRWGKVQGVELPSHDEPLLDTLERWRESTPAPWILLVSSIERVPRINGAGQDEVATVLGMLRAFTERHGDIALYLLARDPEMMGSGPFSSLKPLADSYRLGWFSRDDIAAAWHSSDAEAVVAACYNWTGGQPLLTRLFLQLVAESGPKWHSETIGFHLVDHPPPQQEAWLQALRQILRDSPVLETQVQSVLNGNTLVSPDKHMSSLFLSGWLTPTRGTETEPLWGMPRCFQEWAREVYRDIEVAR